MFRAGFSPARPTILVLPLPTDTAKHNKLKQERLHKGQRETMDIFKSCRWFSTRASTTHRSWDAIGTAERWGEGGNCLSNNISQGNSIRHIQILRPSVRQFSVGLFPRRFVVVPPTYYIRTEVKAFSRCWLTLRRWCGQPCLGHFIHRCRRFNIFVSARGICS